MGIRVSLWHNDIMRLRGMICERWKGQHLLPTMWNKFSQLFLNVHLKIPLSNVSCGSQSNIFFSFRIFMYYSAHTSACQWKSLIWNKQLHDLWWCDVFTMYSRSNTNKNMFPKCGILSREIYIFWMRIFRKLLIRDAELNKQTIKKRA